jgi:hypothetical protein
LSEQEVSCNEIDVDIDLIIRTFFKSAVKGAESLDFLLKKITFFIENAAFTKDKKELLVKGVRDYAKIELNNTWLVYRIDCIYMESIEHSNIIETELKKEYEEMLDSKLEKAKPF